MPFKCTVTYDVSSTVPNQGVSYMHCSRCLKEKPSDVSAKEWSRQQLAVTKEGHLQLWCTRHDINITFLTIGIKEID